MPPVRRYPLLLAVLHQALHHHTDIAVELYDQCLWACYADAREELEEFRKALVGFQGRGLSNVVTPDFYVPYPP
jgi:hypothetical protein